MTAPPDREEVAERPWHAVAAEDALEALGSDPEAGLSAAEVEQRRQRFGPNRLPERGRDSLFEVFLHQFKDPLIYILLIAGTVSLAIGHVQDAGFILAVLAFNSGLGTYQEYRAQNAAAALQKVMKITARVLRDGRRRQVDSQALVPGDLVFVDSGASIPADIRLLRARELRVDESLLTGESTPVEKRVETELDPDLPLGDRATLLHAGSTATSGRGFGVVVRTGELTEIGRIAQSLTEDSQAPPLVQRMRRFTQVIAVAILAAIAVLGLVQLLRGVAPTEIFLLAVALAVSAIPAGLPVAITVALSIGSNRMAARNVIVRNLQAAEGLGACTLIASDKTGTLTENQLTVKRIVPPEGGEIEVTGGGYSPDGGFRRGETPVDPEREGWLRRLAETGALCNEAELAYVDGDVEPSGDTVDLAFLVLARKLGLTRAGLLEQSPQVGDIPFESERRFAAAFHRTGDAVVAHVKGAAGALVGMCDVNADAVLEQEERLAEAGYRVLAVARGRVDADAARAGDPDALHGLTFLGLVGLIDPIRSEVPAAVKACHGAGVAVRMITGDHPATAFAIARELGICDDRRAVTTGREIATRERHEDERAEAEAADEGTAAADDRTTHARVFARVEPRQKTTIVRRLQEAGHFVAVTGDGVNDAPALRKADIGVAMGASGTDVARDAADLILTDDNFASIVNGIEEGRIAYDNVRKVVWLLISTGVAELVLFILSVAFDTPLPLTPVQLLWLNLVTNGIQDVALAFEKGEPDVLARKPRAPDERIFNRLMIEEVLTSGLYMGLVCFAVFYVLIEPLGSSTFEARNLLLLLMVLFENVHALNVRSEWRSAFRIPLRNNLLLVGAIIAAQALHVGSMFVPGWRDLLGVAPVSPATWAILLAITLTKFLVVEAYKSVRGRKLAAGSAARPAQAA